MNIGFLNINRPQSNPEWFYLPLGLLSLATIAKEKGHYSQILHYDDYFLLNDNKINDLVTKIVIDNYDLVCITVNALNISKAITISREIKTKNPDIFIFFGGSQSTFCFEELLSKYNFIDCIAIGEGELVFDKFLTLFNGSIESIKELKGIAYKDISTLKIVKNPEEDLISNLDELSFLDWSLISKPKSKSIVSLVIEVGRGCAYNCTFCSTSLMWKRKFRLKTPNRLIKEINDAYKILHVNHISFIHDNFLLNKKFVKELCRLLINNKIQYTWDCSASINLLDEELVALLSQSGCKMIFMGIESGSDEIQKQIKKNIDLSKVSKTIKLISTYGMRAQQSLIIGFPNETSESMNMSISLALNNIFIGVHVTNLEMLIPLAGTSIYEKHKNNLLYIKNKKYEESFTDEELELIKSDSSLFHYNYGINIYNNIDPSTFYAICKLIEDYLFKIPYSFYSILNALNSNDYYGFAKNLLIELPDLISKRIYNFDEFLSCLKTYLDKSTLDKRTLKKIFRLIILEKGLFISKKSVVISNIELLPNEKNKYSLRNKVIYYIVSEEVTTKDYYKTNIFGVLKYILEREDNFSNYSFSMLIILKKSISCWLSIFKNMLS